VISNTVKSAHHPKYAPNVQNCTNLMVTTSVNPNVTENTVLNVLSLMYVLPVMTIITSMRLLNSVPLVVRSKTVLITDVLSLISV